VSAADDELESEADETEADEPEEDESAAGESTEDGAGVEAQDEAEDGESDRAAGSGEALPEQRSARERPAERTPPRRRTSARAEKPSSNGIDTAAVRAWAAANGLTVSPRGRIKDEVLAAYRAAGN
jgi:hypothetical protein